jgi:short-subunit dehydrogenase
VITADHALKETPRQLCDEISRIGLNIDALVNNAGYGVPGSYVASPWERHGAMVQVMVTGLAELTHHLLPGMLSRRYGRIINVASLAGLVPAPAGHTLYAASKAFVIKFSEALSHEVRQHGIHVTALCPGFTISEFHDVTGTREQMKQMPSWMWMDAPTVARQGYDAVMAGTPIYVNGRVNRTIETMVRYVPQGIVRAIGRRVGRAYRKT